MNDWETVTLADFVDMQFGFPFKSSQYVSDGIKLLRGDNIAQGTLNWDGAKFWPSVDGCKEYSLQTDDVVVAMDRPWIEAGLKYSWIREQDLPCLLVQRVARLRGGDSLNGRFLRYVIGSREFTYHVLAVQTGTAVPHISGKQIAEFEFSKPSIEEQEQIAEILSSLDEKIELNRKQNRTLEAIAQALFKRWFVEFEFPDENGRPYQSSGGAMQPSELGEIPLGWEVGRVGDFVEVTDYVANGSFESLRNNVSLYDNPEYALFVRATDYKGGFCGNLKYTDKSSYEFLKKTALTGDEIIISNVGDIGSVFRPPVWLEQPMTLGSNLIALRSEFNAYLFQMFRSREGQFLINGLVGGSAQPKFNKTEFRSLEVVLPSKTLLQQYAEIESALWEKQIMCNRGIRTLSQLRDTLLPKLMSGELRVGDAA